MHATKIYFPNLNGLRFFAALLVILHHTEQMKWEWGFPSFWLVHPFFGFAGKLGVFFFFVLSGFLITYLLLAEEKEMKRISIGKFYVRRILRIWPLYFLVILFAFALWPHIPALEAPGISTEYIYQDWLIKLGLFVFFLPNLALALFGSVPYAAHTWSIGTEEQFYLVWPVLLNFFRKNRLQLMGIVILLYLLVSALLMWPGSDFIPYKKVIKAFWSSFHIDCMAIGGFFAVLLFQQHALVKWLTNRYLFYGVLLLVAGLLIRGVFIPYFTPEFYALLMGILILNFAVNKKGMISLENPVLHYLGRISYGLYMFHPVGVAFALFICRRLDVKTNWMIYPLVLLITIILAGFSWRYYEQFFLKRKPAFSPVATGDKREPEKEIIIR